MIKSSFKTIKRKGINLIVDLSVQAFLTDEGYDPLYGARPLRRAIMKYLRRYIS
jgi:ATP-dependent Clp protease ATP-binding subunit ClpC